MLDIIWNEPERWRNFCRRLGGMHILMNFIGSIGKLMEGSGLEKLMAKAFGGRRQHLTRQKISHEFVCFAICGNGTLTRHLK